MDQPARQSNKVDPCGNPTTIARINLVWCCAGASSFVKVIRMKLKKLVLLGLIGAAALALSGCDLLGISQEPESQTTSEEQSTNSEAGDEATITFSDSGVSPSEVTVKSGGTITWVNNSSAKVQIGSAKHPTHTENPELTGGQFVTELEPGASASVTVTKTGTWGYHDHLKTSVFGKVIVE